MSTNFDKINVKVAKCDRSKFDLSSDVCETIDMCVERPVFAREMVPSDKFNCTLNHAFRFGSLCAPTFGRLNANYHAFFVPYRIIFKDFPHFWDGTQKCDQSNFSPTYGNATLPCITPQAIMSAFAQSALWLPLGGSLRSTTTPQQSQCDWYATTLSGSISAYRTLMSEESNVGWLNADYPYRMSDIMSSKHLCYEIPYDDGFDFVIPEQMLVGAAFPNRSYVGLHEDATESVSTHTITTKTTSIGTLSTSLSYQDGDTNITGTITNNINNPKLHAFRFTPYGRHFMSMLRGLGYDINMFSACGFASDGTPRKVKNEKGRYYICTSGYKATTATQSYAKMKMSALPLLAWIKIYIDYLKNRKGTHVSMWDCLFKDGASADYNPWLLKNCESLSNLVKVYYDTDYFTATMRTPMDYDGIANTGIDWTQISRSFGTLDTSTGKGQVGNFGVSIDDNTITGSNAYSADGSALRPMFALDGSLVRSVQSVFNYALRNSLAGQRYQDRIFARFGIKPSYARLDMAECVATSRVPISINEVMSTAETLAADDSTSSNVGDYAGKCQQSQSFHASYNADEFGIFIISYNITPKARYPYGINREVLRTDRTMFFNPEFDALGTQSVTFAEMLPPYLDTGKQVSPSTSTFGYLPTYSFYKTGRDRNNGDFSRVCSCDDLKPLSFSRIQSAENIMRADRVGLDNNNNENFLCSTEDMTSYFSIFNNVDWDFDHIFSYAYVACDASRPMSKLFEIQGLYGGQDVTTDAFGNKN